MAAMPQSLLQQFTSCCLAFEQIIPMAKESWWEESYCRLRLWAGDVSLQRKGKSSLEHKLRDASNLQEVVVESFGDLSDTLQQGKSSIGIQNRNHLLTQPLTEDESNEDTNNDTQSDENQPKGNQNDNESSLMELHNIIIDIIDDLYSLSTTLLCPSSHDQFTDPVYQTITPVPHLNDIQHVRETHPTMPGWLCKRLGRGNAQRRLRLAYFKEKAKDKSAREIVDVTQSKAKSKITSSTLLTKADSIFDEPVPQPEYDSEASGSSVTSFTSTTTKEGHGRRNGMPKPPAKFFENVAFECPVCFSILDDIRSLKEWRRHVSEDLKPYMCTHENCRQAEVLFAHRRQWFQHELSTHFVHWLCSTEGCGKSFATEDNFIRHLETSHSTACGDSQCAAVAHLCKVGAYSNSTFTCPLCFKQSKSKKSFRRHLGRELVELALFVLPPGGILDSDSDSSGGSENEDVLDTSSPNALRNSVLDFGDQLTSNQADVPTTPRSPIPNQPLSGYLPHQNIHRSPSIKPELEVPISPYPTSDRGVPLPHLSPKRVHRSPSSSPELEELIPPPISNGGDNSPNRYTKESQSVTNKHPYPGQGVNIPNINCPDLNTNSYTPSELRDFYMEDLDVGESKEPGLGL
ncbi:hypothetical protein BGZ60DRAFT_529422 [Tricladium varicosporioides]|nr:hypothetical protein BGZ60DRAFT_529422 [Hymenoscyphus varicosporioides]